MLGAGDRTGGADELEEEEPGEERAGAAHGVQHSRIVPGTFAVSCDDDTAPAAHSRRTERHEFHATVAHEAGNRFS